MLAIVPPSASARRGLTRPRECLIQVRVQQNVVEMVPGGIHTPGEIVETPRHPRDGDIVSEEDGRPHPGEPGPSEAAIERVGDEIVGVVPIDEVVRQGRCECDEGRDRHTGDDAGADTPGCGSPPGPRGRQPPSQMWIAWPRAASVASRAASDKVGWAWIVWMISSSVASRVRPTANSWIISVASGPMMCTPRISPVALSATTLMKPSVSPSATALPFAVNGKRPTDTSRPASRARASVEPIEAICGWQ